LPGRGARARGPEALLISVEEPAADRWIAELDPWLVLKPDAAHRLLFV
jgi:hypothetical protein